MEARFFSATMIVASALSLGASYRTQNFVVTTPSPQLAREIGDAAEQYRSRLAVEWLGRELPPWRAPCPIRVHAGPHLGAGGQTSFMFDRGTPFGWQMNIQGSRERLLDSVLPHEVTHTIFATHFGRPLPRWADEGACTTVEHVCEKSKQQKLLYTFLTTGRGIAFNEMFAMKEYPADILPLYSQGYALARFLIAQGGRQKFMEYIADGMRSNNWTVATNKHYEYESLSELQLKWLDWVRRGSPPIEPKTTLIAQQDGGQEQPARNDLVWPLGHRTTEDAQLPASTRTTLSGSWYARQRDLTQNPSTTDSATAGGRSVASNDRSHDATGTPTPLHNSVTRPQPIGTPQPIVIPWQPQPSNPNAASPTSPQPQVLSPSVHPVWPVRRY
jgi:hypothetical protein